LLFAELYAASAQATLPLRKTAMKKGRKLPNYGQRCSMLKWSLNTLTVMDVLPVGDSLST